MYIIKKFNDLRYSTLPWISGAMEMAKELEQMLCMWEPYMGVWGAETEVALSMCRGNLSDYNFLLLHEVSLTIDFLSPQVLQLA